jgi:hypothetical protein
VGLGGEYAVAAEPVDRLVARGRDQPGPGIGGYAVPRPALSGDDEGFLADFLGEIEIAEEADQRRQDTPPFVAEDPLDQESISMIGRTSTEPPMRAAGICAANSIAVSRSPASSR